MSGGELSGLERETDALTGEWARHSRGVTDQQEPRCAAVCRIEVESLLGAVVRRGRATGVNTPMIEALYAVLKPHAGGSEGVKEWKTQ